MNEKIDLRLERSRETLASRGRRGFGGRHRCAPAAPPAPDAHGDARGTGRCRPRSRCCRLARVFPALSVAGRGRRSVRAGFCGGDGAHAPRASAPSGSVDVLQSLKDSLRSRGLDSRAVTSRTCPEFRRVVRDRHGDRLAAAALSVATSSLALMAGSVAPPAWWTLWCGTSRCCGARARGATGSHTSRIG